MRCASLLLLSGLSFLVGGIGVDSPFFSLLFLTLTSWMRCTDGGTGQREVLFLASQGVCCATAALVLLCYILNVIPYGIHLIIIHFIPPFFVSTPAPCFLSKNTRSSLGIRANCLGARVSHPAPRGPSTHRELSS